ncbi:tetratricopeptide (TPR) repeat protein [Methanolinea mesophila]|uniref:tetratricopeptide repeat protein n=1 Tax=Methanolinea mesophila TaxID=547055 RepID=UPI001AE659D6|nr:tetratricopeptide repeat protein [Methanolinea mesophila]MBP1929463.1 tetratricopeptide (TPR) repeat protein [Methanolinea mesophila]
MRLLFLVILSALMLACLSAMPAGATDAKTWYNQGEEFRQKGDYSAAVDAYRNAVSIDPGYTDAWYSLAYVCVQTERLDDAADAYLHVLAVEPDMTPALKGLAYVYSRQGKDEAALTEINHALEINSGDQLAWLQKGLTLSALGRTNESIVAYTNVIELAPDNFDAWLCMGLDYYSIGNYPSALDAFERATDIDERSAIAWQYKGDTLFHMGRYQEAIEGYNRGLIVSPGNADLIQARAKAESALRSYIGGNTSGSTAGTPSMPDPLAQVLLLAAVAIVAAGLFLFIRMKRSAVRGSDGGRAIYPPPASGPEYAHEPGDRIGGDHHDVFISYSSNDKAVADATCASLESRGIRCWIAPRDVLPGSNYPRSIVEAIDGSRVMVLVYSSHSNSSPHVVRELTHAVSRGVIIIPFRIENIPPSKDMEYLIGIPHWLDAMTPPLERHLVHLADTIRVLLPSAESPERNDDPR